MFKHLTIVNYQTHRKLEVELDPKVTTIVGVSDVGKSAILRALRWVCLNKPGGEADRRWGSKNTTVKLRVGKKVIVRKRGKANIYKLGDKTFKAFGTEPPTDIQNILRVDDTNFQQQLEQHFWFSLTPGQVSKQLNRIVNLDVIDKSQSTINAELRKAKTVVDVIRNRLRDAKTELKTLAWVPRCERELTRLKSMSEHLEALSNKQVSLQRLVRAITRLQMEGDSLTDKGVTAKARLKQARSLLGLQRRIEDLAELTAEIEKGEQIRAATIPDMIPIGKSISNISQLSQLIYQIEELETQCHAIKTKNSRRKERLSKQKICPVCGKPR